MNCPPATGPGRVAGMRFSETEAAGPAQIFGMIRERDEYPFEPLFRTARDGKRSRNGSAQGWDQVG